MKTVYLGMSGGVDSSVAAALLKEQGYRVIGVYMKNWSQDLPGLPCPWREDYQDAKRVAVQLGIEFKLFDFEKQYRHKVVDYMLEQYKAGLTPNPDIMCNQEIKFKLFLNTALEQGADLIATGHYARIVDSSWQIANGKKKSSPATTNYQLPTTKSLAMAKDANKDQSYFLYRVSSEALSKTLFPLGDLTKPEVRALAKKFSLVTADKKESMGICFVGKVGIKDFLSQFVSTKPGEIIDQNGKLIGEHDGAIFYTIGQRHGLNTGGGLPYYVSGKSMPKNEVYVTTNLDDKNLWADKLELTSCHWITGHSPVIDSRWQIVNGKEKGSLKTTNYQLPTTKLSVRIRHQAKPLVVKQLLKKSCNYELYLEDQTKAPAPGQSAVIYQKNVCLGGGVIV